MQSAAPEGDARRFEWRFLFVAGMWFQDLFNYDGEISFCANNTGVGWRQIVEKMKRTATVADWYRTRGRHPVCAKQQNLPFGRRSLEHRLARRLGCRTPAFAGGRTVDCGF